MSVGARVGGADVTFSLAGGVSVDGVADALSAGTPQVLAGGSLVAYDPASYAITWATGEVAYISDTYGYFDVSIRLGPDDGPGSVQGLMGSHGGPGSDVQLADGTVLDPALGTDELTRRLSQSWQVAPGQSLLLAAPAPAASIQGAGGSGAGGSGVGGATPVAPPLSAAAAPVASVTSEPDDGPTGSQADNTPIAAPLALDIHAPDAASATAAPITGSLDVPGQANRYSFTLTQASQFYFDSLTNSSQITWSLTGPAGTVIDHRTFSQDASQLSTSPVLALGAGDYVLTVDASGDATGAYSFRLLDLATATPSSPGTAVTGTLTPGNSTNAYRFSADAGERVYFQTQAGGNNLSWRLLDSSGQQVFQSGFGDQNVTLGVGGAYTLLLEGSPYATTPSSYGFTLFAQADQAAPLTLGTANTGTVAQPGQLSVYSFALAGETRVAFDALAGSGAITWTLTGPGGVRVTPRSFVYSDATGLGGTPLLDLTAGAYQLTVTGTGGQVGAFAFRLLDAAAATTVTRDVSVSGVLGDGGVTAASAPGRETQLFSFSAMRGDQVQLVVPAAQPGIYYRLIDPSGAEVNEGTLASSGTLTLRLTGTYVLSVEGALSNTAPVPFGFTVASQGTTSLPVLTGTPLGIGIGTAVAGTFASAGEVDDYLVTTTGPTRLVFDPLTSSYATALSATWQIDGPDGPVVGSQSFLTDQIVTLAAAGSHRVRVTGQVAGQQYGFVLLDPRRARRSRSGRRCPVRSHRLPRPTPIRSRPPPATGSTSTPRGTREACSGGCSIRWDRTSSTPASRRSPPRHCPPAGPTRCWSAGSTTTTPRPPTASS